MCMSWNISSNYNNMHGATIKRKWLKYFISPAIQKQLRRLCGKSQVIIWCWPSLLLLKRPKKKKNGLIDVPRRQRDIWHFRFLKFFFFSWFMLRLLPLEKCNNFYLLYLSCLTGYTLVACGTHFSKEYYFYSNLFGWLSMQQCLKPYNCAVKSSWTLFHTKYLACSICDRVDSTRQFTFRLNYKMC